jgi:hypothetical protein
VPGRAVEKDNPPSAQEQAQAPEQTNGNGESLDIHCK